MVKYNVIPTSRFIEDIEYYKKKKRYRKIDDDVTEIVNELTIGNLIGDAIADLHLPEGENSYKVRAANSDLKVGKSNGYRIIYYVIKNDFEIYLLTIYSKKDQEDISSSEIVYLINEYCK